MNTEEAKSILAVYRPNVDDRDDPLVAEALSLAERDPDLKRWCEEYWKTQNTLRQSLRHLPVPPQLQREILEHRPMLRFPVGQRWLAVAAAFVLFAVAAWFLRAKAPDSFDNYRERMVRNAIRQYQMDIFTHDPAVIRTYLTTNQSPHDYVVPAGLERLQTTGAARLGWRGHPVSMVCFDRGDKQMLFLFVMERKSVRNPPEGTPQSKAISHHTSVSWSDPSNVYVLAGPTEAQFAEKYLQR